MATTTPTSTTRAKPASITQVLLRRRGVVHIPAGDDRPDPAAQAGVTLLEADLAERGWLLSPALRDALLRLDTADLTGVGSRLLADCDELIGAARNHTPLFRGFPHRVPDNTLKLLVDRILTTFFQQPEQPCVLCRADRTVRPVNPCGHLVCGDCFRPADYSACPICHRQIDRTDPYLTAGHREQSPVERRRAKRRPVNAAGPARLRVLHLGDSLHDDVRAELTALLARPTALPPVDVDDLELLLATEDRTDLSWLPGTIPGRETKARLLAWLLADPIDTATAQTQVSALVDTATDVLRLLVARSGGESLIDRSRIAPVPRPLRRVLLAALDRIDPVQLVEDMRRHRRAWIAVGERLHPGEYVTRWPGVALAFAVLRRTDLNTHPACDAILTALDGRPESHLWLDGSRVHAAVRARRVEEAMAGGDTLDALALLRARPGELLRRADHLLRTAQSEATAEVVSAIGEAAHEAAPAVVLSALGELRTRGSWHPSRVFFPAGRTARAHVVPEQRLPLPPALVANVEQALTAAVLDRLAALSPVARAVVDTGLDGVIAPFAERTASRALVTLARGSVLPVPVGRFLRLFVHWTESDERVDLDLSVAVYDDTWQHVATCDYTSLNVPGAVHSGDLTSAPAPRGSSEFIDLDVEVLARNGGRYAVVSVLSYNNVPFVEMAEAFAGFMIRDDRAGDTFDARAVEQRFDLTGPGKVTIPFVVDLRQRTMRWLDVDARVTGTNHAVHRHSDQFATVAGALVESFEAGGRVTLGELGRWIAAARSREVILRGLSGMTLFRRAEGEPASTFALRLSTGISDAPATAEDAAGAALQFVARGDLPAPDGAEVFALYADRLDAGRVRLLAAADVAGMLAAATK